MQEEHLKNLGLDPRSKHTTTELKKAWRKKCTEHHPDKGGDQKEFQKVMHSYKMLTDASYRHKEDVKDRGPKGGLNINLTVPITFEDAFFGREVVVTYNIVELDEDSSPLVDKEFEVVCTKVRVPPGSFSYSYKVEGKGLKKGGERGDAFIAFQAMPNKKFKMDPSGVDTIASEKVPLDIMLKGGEFEFLTMWGLRTAKIPPGSKEGDTIYIKNCGISKKGRHRVILSSIYPTREELKSKDTWKGLNIDWGEEDEEETNAQRRQDEEFEKLFIKFGSSTTTTGGL